MEIKEINQLKKGKVTGWIHSLGIGRKNGRFEEERVKERKSERVREGKRVKMIVYKTLL